MICGLPAKVRHTVYPPFAFFCSTSFLSVIRVPRPFFKSLPGRALKCSAMGPVFDFFVAVYAQVFLVSALFTPLSRAVVSMPLVLSFAHDMPIVHSDGIDFPSGDILPAGCWVLVGFAKDDIGLFEGGKITEAMDVLCTERPGVPKRTRDQVSLLLFNFRPKCLPPDMFNTLRALPCKLNSDIRKWNPKRLSLAVSIRELWHWCTASRQRCTRDWLLLPTPFF